MISVSGEVIVAELETMKAIVDKWINNVNQGIPGVDRSANAEDIDAFLKQLYGELTIVASKAHQIASLLAEDGSI